MTQSGVGVSMRMQLPEDRKEEGLELEERAPLVLRIAGLRGARGCLLWSRGLVGAVGWLVGWLLFVEWFVCMLLRGKKKKKKLRKGKKKGKKSWFSWRPVQCRCIENRVIVAALGAGVNPNPRTQRSSAPSVAIRSQCHQVCAVQTEMGLSPQVQAGLHVAHTALRPPSASPRVIPAR